MPSKDPAKQKEYYEKNKEKYKEQARERSKKYREHNNNTVNEKQKQRCDDKTQNAIDSITSRCIVDHEKWDLWCNQIKSRATNKKHPYSDDFSNDIIFEMMVRGCFYCGDIATTIDRLDSDLEHTSGNCVGCCHGCNISKGVADSATFIRKAYYRARGYYRDDDTNIWFVHKKKPSRWDYNDRASKKRVPFELIKKQFEDLIVGECAYCHRNPTTWFGIDRVVPSLGYVNDNVVSCCWDCNNDKHKYNVETAIERNERIAQRVEDGDVVIENLPRVIIHNGTRKSSKND